MIHVCITMIYNGVTLTTEKPTALLLFLTPPPVTIRHASVSLLLAKQNGELN